MLIPWKGLRRVTLLDQFEESVSSSGAEFHSCKPDKAVKTLSEILSEIDHTHGIYSTDSDELVPGICKQIAMDAFHLESTSETNIRDLSESITNSGIGIVRGYFGLIPQGTIAVEMSEDHESALSLIPEVSVIIIQASEIYEDGLKFFQKLEENYTSDRDNWVLISGPSATADMGSLVTGVHGPKIVHVLTLEDIEYE